MAELNHLFEKISPIGADFYQRLRQDGDNFLVKVGVWAVIDRLATPEISNPVHISSFLGCFLF
ncbi:MAG TPA: hypothetical protein PLR18_01400 [bacterium]|nr:hypothetical protein [bacterium]